MSCCKRLEKEIWKISNKPEFELYDTVYIRERMFDCVNIGIIIGEPDVISKKYSTFGERYFYYNYPILKIGEGYSFVSSARECDLSKDVCKAETTICNDLGYLQFWNKISENNTEETQRQDNGNQQTA